MYQDTLTAVAETGHRKSAMLGTSLPRYLVQSALAGAYVGLGIALIFAIGAPLAAAQSPFLKLVMGASFGVALTLVMVAGAELFTGNAMTLTVSALSGRAGWKQLAWVWGWSYLGNLVGSIAVAWLIAQSGALGGDPQRAFVESTANTKMHLDFGTAFARGILANWLVCLAVWCAARLSSEVARLVVVFWCLFAFIGAGFEHSIANMTLLALALFQPHADTLTWLGYVQNLVPVTLGNVVGGAVLVAGAYWFASPVKFPAPQAVREPAPMPTVSALAAEPAA